MAARRITRLLLAGYAALFGAMVCFGLGLLLEGTWAAGSAVVGLLLVWFAHRVVDAPARAAKAAERAAARAAAKAAQPSPFNFATVAANGEVVQEREEQPAHEADDEDDRPAKVVASRAAAQNPASVAAPAPAPAPAPSASDAGAGAAESAPQEDEQQGEQEAGAAAPGRILSLEEVRADMALLRQAMLASRPAAPSSGGAAGHPQPASGPPGAGAPSTSPSTPPTPEAPGTPRPLPMVDLFARTEVAGLEVSFGEHEPHADDDAAFPKTEMADVDEARRTPEDDFPKTQFDKRPS
jgi:hypothetical protein